MDIKKLKGIGEKTFKSLSNKGITSLDDLIHFFPYKYENRTKELDFYSTDKGYFIGTILDKKIIRTKNNKSILILNVSFNEYIIEVVFFNHFYIDKQIKISKEYIFYGFVERKYNRIKMIHPKFASITEAEKFISISPIYSVIRGVSNQKLISFIEQAIIFSDKEIYNKKFLNKNNMINFKEAIKELHFPTDKKNYIKARNRYIFYEFYNYLSGLNKNSKAYSSSYKYSQKLLDDFKSRFSFELTKDQLKVINEVKTDLVSSYNMNRLLLADVGSGKSVIAYFGIYLAKHNNKQSSYLAPTEILATQQYKVIKALFKEFRVLLLTSKTKNKKKLYKEIREGNYDVVVGTHAIFQDDVIFKDLDLIITDEQQRFGVNQRKKMLEKGENPNYLMLSATPIPRTMSMLINRNVDLSIMKEKPKDRIKIETNIVYKNDIEKVFKHIDEEIKKDNLIYIVYPLIDDSDKIELESIENNIDILSKRFKDDVDVLHGKMKGELKEEIINRFISKKFHVLVSTTVIEVGIDVLDATIIVINESNRYGLSQLHQLRGRVGRSNKKSFCYLVTEDRNNKRLKILNDTDDGFKIAEEDLLLRGPGEIRGTTQHGELKFKFADIIKHENLLRLANDVLEGKYESDIR